MRLRSGLLTGLLLAALAATGCGDSAPTATVTVTHTVKEAAAATTTTSPQTPSHRPKKRWKRCDQNIRAKVGTTSCGFAENVFYGFWRALQQGDDGFRAYSPVTHRRYALTCVDDTIVVCRAGDGAVVRFSRASIDRYTESDAEAFCFAHTVTPTEDACGPPTDADSESYDSTYDPYADDLDDPSEDYDPAGAVDEDDYSDHDGTYDGAPTTEDFGDGQGSVGLCADGTYSDSIGRPGACSHHGGVG